MGITPTQFFLVLLEAVLDFYGPRVMVVLVLTNFFIKILYKIL